MARPMRVLLAVSLGILVGACGGSTATAPAGSASAVPSPSDAAASPVPSAVAANPNVTFACLGLAELDCGRVLEAAVAALLPADPPVIYAEVGPFGCRNGQGCDGSLISRPEGRVLFEVAEGDGIEVQVKLGADGELALDRAQAFGVKVAPSSPRGQLAGPMPFTLGHCGLGSGVDVDGSFWDPVGLVNSDHGDSINAAEGTVVPTDPNRATFTSDGGLVVNLVRRDGEKYLPLCM